MRATSGRRCGPRTINATARITTNSGNPIPNMAASSPCVPGVYQTSYARSSVRYCIASARWVGDNRLPHRRCQNLTEEHPLFAIKSGQLHLLNGVEIGGTRVDLDPREQHG